MLYLAVSFNDILFIYISILIMVHIYLKPFLISLSFKTRSYFHFFLYFPFSILFSFFLFIFTYFTISVSLSSHSLIFPYQSSFYSSSFLFLLHFFKKTTHSHQNRQPVMRVLTFLNGLFFSLSTTLKTIEKMKSRNNRSILHPRYQVAKGENFRGEKL